MANYSEMAVEKVVVILNNSHWQTMSKNDCMAVNNTTGKVLLC